MKLVPSGSSGARKAPCTRRAWSGPAHGFVANRRSAVLKALRYVPR